ncbi:MAG: Type 1 glutamine amidotransferase-like domain-containing protein [Candidatus Bathyarchaeia archaeon]|jgi:peptidase E
MPKLYLLGGENVVKRSALEVNERAFQDAEMPCSVVVFPWARASFDRKYQKRKILTDYFLSLGAGNVDFVEYSDPIESIAQKISSSNLIYLTGGYVNALVERLRKRGAEELLREYPGVIVGRSAGALALCKKCVITCRCNQKVSLVDGLGLADLSFKAHYKPQKDPALQLLSKGEKIYAVPSKSAIVYDYGVRSVIGSAYIFEDGQKNQVHLSGSSS